MTVLYEAQDRIAYAVEGAVIAGQDAMDLVRERFLVVLAALAAIAVAAVAIIAMGGGSDVQVNSQSGAAQSGAVRAATADPVFIKERGFSLSLPATWERADAPDGASFAAASEDGLAKTTLWAERAPGLSFGAFVEQSMASLDELGTRVRISDEVTGPTLASRVTELRAEVPLDGGLSAAYHVVLRASGPYRYYLATSLQPGAPEQLGAEAELLGTSFRPQVVEPPTASATAP